MQIFESLESLEKLEKGSVLTIGNFDGVHIGHRTILKKLVDEGQYVKMGMPLFQIVDLRKVWVKLDAYESDLSWIRNGQEVELEAEAYPGEVFKGKIGFIDPFLDAKTRTVKVRVNVPNSEGKLKPEMFVRARITIQHLMLSEQW